MIDFVYVSILYPVTLLNSPTNYRRGGVCVGGCVHSSIFYIDNCVI